MDVLGVWGFGGFGLVNGGRRKEGSDTEFRELDWRAERYSTCLIYIYICVFIMM